MRTILVFILVLLLPASLLGQDLSTGLTVNTNPPGARVILDGDITITGLSPVSFPGELQGRFKLTIKEEGYETYRQSLNLYSGRLMEINLGLRPKTRYKAVWRSLIIPGWGQIYSGRKTKGVIFTLLAIGATSYYFIADNDFYEKLDDYSLIRSRYFSEKNEAEKALLYSQFKTARHKAYDAESNRINAIGGVIGIWAISLIDALFLFPQQKNIVPINSLSIRPGPNQGGAQIVFSHRF